MRTVRELNREWTAIGDRASRLVASWGLDADAVRGCRSLNDVLARARRQPDAVLGQLLQVGHHRAYRTVLQAVLGGVVRLSLTDPANSATDYVNQLWDELPRYPLRSRPRAIKANMLMDARKHLAADRRLRPTSPLSFDALTPTGPAEPATAAEVLAASKRLLDADAITALRAIYIEGHSSRQAANTLGWTAANVRYHCSRSLRRLRECADLLR
ncbi:MAG: hypothetical protein LBR32_07525 [Propionibacteriaceae bacterium]|jgi:hypothetical protein|nr:hypothetical protein [Propionibacteriaceae bacterium]